MYKFTNIYNLNKTSNQRWTYGAMTTTAGCTITERLRPMEFPLRRSGKDSIV